TNWGADVTKKATTFGSATPTRQGSTSAQPNRSTSNGSNVSCRGDAMRRPGEGTASGSVTPTRPITVSPEIMGSRDPARFENDMNTTRKLWPVTEALLRQMQLECAAHGAKLVVVRLPVCQNWRNDLETQLLGETLKQYQIPYIDTSAAFVE